MLTLLTALLCILSGGGVYIFLQKKISVLNNQNQILETEKKALEEDLKSIQLENSNIFFLVNRKILNVIKCFGI